GTSSTRCEPSIRPGCWSMCTARRRTRRWWCAAPRTAVPSRLIARAGAAAVTGPNGIFGQLAANGLDVFPSNDVASEGSAEDRGYSGGYTVGTYSQGGAGIDAVQMEFGTRYRHDAGLDLAVRATGKALVAFYETYLKQPGD